MKRILSLILCVALLFCFAGCKEEKPENVNTGNGVDLEKVVTEGKIPELAVRLGMSADDVKTLHNYNKNAVGETGFYIFEEDDATYFQTETAAYYYLNDKKSKGISAIVALTSACGLTLNAFETPNDVKAAFPNIEFTEGEVTKEDKYFLVGGDEFTKLSFEKGSHRIDFVFYENQLNTVILIDTENWSN